MIYKSASLPDAGETREFPFCSRFLSMETFPTFHKPSYEITPHNYMGKGKMCFPLDGKEAVVRM